MRFNPRPGWTRAVCVTPVPAAAGAGWRRRWVAAPASRPRRHPAGGGIGLLLIILVIVMLKACGGVDLTGAITGGGLDGTDQPVHRHRQRAVRRVHHRPGRQRPPDHVRPGRGRELPQRLLGEAPSPSRPRERRTSRSPRSTPSAARPRRRVRPGVVGDGSRSTARPTRRSTSTRRFFEEILQGQLNGPSRRLRRALRHRPRVRPPHPEPAGHHGPGEDPAGPEQRLGAARAPGRLLRRHVGAQRHRRPRTPRATC